MEIPEETLGSGVILGGVLKKYKRDFLNISNIKPTGVLVEFESDFIESSERVREED